MADFMYLYRGSGESQPMAKPSPEDMQKMMKSYMDWFEAMKKNGHFKDPGAKLAMKGKVVRGGHQIVMDGPFAETKDVIGGYMILSAKDLDEAVGLLKDAPFAQGGGMIEVRPIQPMNM